MDRRPAPAEHPTGSLADDELLHDLELLYQRRLDTLRHGADAALEASTRRITELEKEYVRRFPDREVDPGRVRPPS
jgi:hypothetical protein